LELIGAIFGLSLYMQANLGSDTQGNLLWTKLIGANHMVMDHLNSGIKSGKETLSRIEAKPSGCHQLSPVHTGLVIVVSQQQQVIKQQ
jgi:hypothetical protein